MPRCGPGMLDRYGDLSAGFRVGRGIWVGSPEGDTAWMPDVSDAKPGSCMMKRTRKGVTAA